MLKVNNEFEVRNFFRILNLVNLPNKLILSQFSVFNCNKNSHSQVLQTICVLKNFVKISRKTNVLLSSAFGKVADALPLFYSHFSMNYFNNEFLKYLGVVLNVIGSEFSNKTEHIMI